jgi:ParB family chromosome partitioning protein
MSNRRSAWIDRRGQRGADAAIDQVIERQPHAGEQVQQVADELIEDSPYQARQTFNIESVKELAQGMREAGFQGVLIVRPHSDPAKRRRGIVQLVYGHRRRLAWRQVCSERESPCLVPVVVREVSDAQLLIVGAQENLQRQELDPIEEAQIVAWHERMFFDKNQQEIGMMLGKSSDWVSVRSRIHRLPDALKDRLRQRPRAIGQMLELGMYYAQQPSMVVLLADRVVNENLTVAAIRTLVREAIQPALTVEPNREEVHNRRANTTIVQDITTDLLHTPFAAPVPEESHERLGAEYLSPERSAKAESGERSGRPNRSDPLNEQLDLDASSKEEGTSVTADLTVLQEAAAALTSIASRAEALPNSVVTQKAIHQIEQALAVVRRALASHTYLDKVITTAAPREVLRLNIVDNSDHPL